jgi:hypothetical protein
MYQYRRQESLASSNALASSGGSAEGKETNRRPDYQGLRAFAVIIVVAFHAGLPAPGGFVGVDVFFVISGFVITAMLHREWLENGAIRFQVFYLRWSCESRAARSPQEPTDHGKTVNRPYEPSPTLK